MRTKIISISFLLMLFSSIVIAQQTTVTPLTMEQFVGINARAKDSLYRMKKFNFIREYHDWSADISFNPSNTSRCVQANDGYSWAPSDDQSVLLSYDDFYAAFSKKCMPTLNGVAPTMRNASAWNGTLLDQKALCVPANYPFNSSSVPPISNYLQYFPTVTDQENPAYYKEHTRWVSMFTARYGNVVFSPAEALEITDVIQPYLAAPSYGYSNPFLSGQKRIRFIENSNEPDKYWYDAASEVFDANNNLDIDNGKTYWQYKPKQYAAMLSADYDGHGKSTAFAIIDANGNSVTQGVNRWGIHNIDPSQKIVMAATADLRGAYIEKMLAWFDSNRRVGQYGFTSTTAKIIPFDVVNFHHYSSKAGSEKTLAPLQNNPNTNNFNEFIYKVYGNYSIGDGGVSPEKDDLRKKLEYTLTTLYDYTKTNVATDVKTEWRSKKFWISEFGYDTHPFISASATNIPDKYDNQTSLSQADRLKTQGDWLIRTYLELAAVKAVVTDGSYTYTGIVDRAQIFDIVDKEPTPCTDGTWGSTCSCCGLFSHSGILSKDFNPKKAWYHVMTLKNVLTSYIFDADISNSSAIKITNASNVTIPGLRVYRFRHKDNLTASYPTFPLSSASDNALYKFIYVVWSPTFTNYSAANSRINFTTATATPNNATVINIQDLDENGVKSALSLSGTNKFVSFKVSETPTFIYTSYAPANALVADADVKPITNLTVSSVCCNAVKLSWTLPTGVTTSMIQSYQIYYTKDASYNSSTFSIIPDAKLYTDVLVGSSKSCVVAGLEPNISYRFFVVPVMKITLSTPTIADIKLSSAAGTVSGCSGVTNCINTVTAAQLSQNSPEIANTFISNGDVCSQINTTTNNSVNTGWFNFDYNNASNNAVEIDLGQSKKLNAIYILDSYGKGRILIEYLDCAGCWKTLRKMPLDPFYGSWMFLTNLTNNIMTKIRVTKLDYDAKFSKMYFCTYNAECTPHYTVFNPTPISSVSVRDIDNETATVEWNACQTDNTEPESDYIYKYTLDYSTHTDASGNPTDATRIFVNADPNDANPNCLLSNLVANTHYYGLLKISASADECFYGTSFPQSLFEFTTAGNPAEIRANEGHNTPAPHSHQEGRLLVFPNPSKDIINVRLPDLAYDCARLIRADGTVVKSLILQRNSDQFAIDCTNLASGLYLLQVSMGTDASLFEKIIINH